MMSPRLACVGTLIRTRAIGLTLRRRRPPSVTITSTLSDQNVPSLSSRDRDDLSASRRGGCACDHRPAGARAELETPHVGLRVLLVEDVDGLDVIGSRHRAVDRYASAAPYCRSRPSAADRASPCRRATVASPTSSRIAAVHRLGGGGGQRRAGARPAAAQAAGDDQELTARRHASVITRHGALR